MPNERVHSPPPRDKDILPKQPTQGRNGEGSHSVLQHLKNDQKARAVVRVREPSKREW